MASGPVPNPFSDSRDADDDRPVRVRVDCKCGRSMLVSRPGPIDNCPRCGGESHRTMTAHPVDLF